MRSIFVLFLFLISIISDGQVLILKNKKNHRTVIFKKGDVIVYKLNDSESGWHSGKIDFYDNTWFAINDHAVKLSQIAAMEVPRKNFNFGGCGGTLFLVGFLIPTMSVFNDLINADKPRLNQTQWMVTCSFLATGIILSQLATKKCVIGKKYSIEILLW